MPKKVLKSPAPSRLAYNCRFTCRISKTFLFIWKMQLISCATLKYWLWYFLYYFKGLVNYGSHPFWVDFYTANSYVKLCLQLWSTLTFWQYLVIHIYAQEVSMVLSCYRWWENHEYIYSWWSTNRQPYTVGLYNDDKS